MFDELKTALIALINASDRRAVADLVEDALARFDPDDLEWQDLNEVRRKYRQPCNGGNG